MAQTTPKPESILADVATKLATISTTASAFRTTVATVNRQFVDPQTIKGTKLPLLAIFDESIKYDVHGIGSSPRQEGELTFKIQGALIAHSAPATAVMNLIQDVREKLYEDRSRGGYADNTHVTEVEVGGDGFGNKQQFVAKPFVGFLMTVIVQFQENL